jgi:hypothetical protein
LSPTYSRVTEAAGLLAELDVEQDHAKAATLAFAIAKLAPELVQYIQALELASAKQVRSLEFKCLWCGDEFKVYMSELSGEKKSGKYCSKKCLDEQRASDREARVQGE